MRQVAWDLKGFTEDQLPTFREALQGAYRDTITLDFVLDSVGANINWSNGEYEWALAPDDTELVGGYAVAMDEPGSAVGSAIAGTEFKPTVCVWLKSHTFGQVTYEAELTQANVPVALSIMNPSLKKGAVLGLRVKTAPTGGAITNLRVRLLGRLAG